MCFYFRGSIKPIFENHVFRAFAGPFHPLYEAKISNRSLSVVYGSITLKFFSGALGTSPHQWGHSCNISNTPNLGGKKLKTAFSVFLVYFWYGLILTDIEKVRGKLKIFSNTFIWQDLRFFCPRDRLAISDKITCQIPNFICQTLEKSLQFADQTYKLRKCICFQVFHKIWFFLAKKWIGNIFLNFVNLRWNFFSQHVPSSLCLPSSSSRHIFHSTATWSQLFEEESNQKLLFHFQMHW